MLDNLLTLLVKVHSRLYWNKLISSLDSSVAQSSAQDSAFVNLSTQLDPQLLAAAEAAGLTSVFSARCMAILNDTNANNTAMGEVMRGAMENKFGDGSFWVARLLDRIIEVSPACKASLKAFLERAKNPFGTAPHIGGDPKAADKEKDEGRVVEKTTVLDTVHHLPHLLSLLLSSIEHLAQVLGHTARCQKRLKHVFFTNSVVRFFFVDETGDGDVGCFCCVAASKLKTQCTMIPGVHSSAASRAKRKMMASERRKRLLDQMASKQRAFASNFLKDVDLGELAPSYPPGYVYAGVCVSRGQVVLWRAQTGLPEPSANAPIPLQATVQLGGGLLLAVRERVRPTLSTFISSLKQSDVLEAIAVR
ncbi:unnamed protein product [Dibothriocephalus latus]|uniref:Uncharacterized protein n=1 Tax=Dibothriocephalus latus TaxID=60516 RepID=A0A3P7PIN1_DIBLA|nr:unnamed protein product [Dibothriocephalus latus]